MVHFLAGVGILCLHHHMQTASGAHSDCCPVGTRSSFPSGKNRTWNWSLTSIQHWD